MKKRFLLNNLGISLVEAMVVIVIIGVLLLIWKFISSGHIKIAIVNEGRTFVEKVIAQERMYRANKGEFLTTATPTYGYQVNNSANSDILMINTHDNRYFKQFTVTLDTTGGINVTAIGTGKADGMSVVGAYTPSNNRLNITENGIS